MRASRSIAIVAILAAVIFNGCARFRTHEPTKYQTVVTDGRHDTATAKAKHQEAVCLIGQCQYCEAEELLNEALVADTTYGPAHNSLGVVYLQQKKRYLAAWEFEYAVKLMPNMAEPYNNLGLVYEQAGKYQEAINYFNIALSLDPNNPELIGNYVRARMLTGDRSSDLKLMLSDLALKHEQIAWQQWARDQVELTKFEEPTQMFFGDGLLSEEGLEEAAEALDLRRPDQLKIILPLPQTPNLMPESLN